MADYPPLKPHEPREKNEHSYEIIRRLRARLGSLAQLATSPPQQAFTRSAHVAIEALAILEIKACIFQRVGPTGPETIAVQRSDEISVTRLERIASRLSAEVVEKNKTITINDLQREYSSEKLLIGSGIHSFIGVPLRDPNGSVICIAALMGSTGRKFEELDEWWLKSAGQPVADALAYEAIEAKLLKAEEMISIAAPAAELMDEKPPKLSVLVVDDDRAVNDMICDFLAEEGYTVQPAYDGIDAIRKFKPAEHDVVLSDIAMPHMNGWELIAALHVRAPELPIVLITGYSRASWNEQFLRKQGVRSFISKPINFRFLTGLLEDISRNKLSQEEIQPAN
jgi:CheY-like chemotaxis protein